MVVKAAVADIVNKMEDQDLLHICSSGCFSGFLI